MLDRFAEFFLLHPKRLVPIGEAHYSVASALAMLGACTHVYLGAVAAIDSLGRQVQGRQLRLQSTIADLLPGLSTWRISETLAGFVFVIPVAMVGVVIAREGRNLERFLAS